MSTATEVHHDVTPADETPEGSGHRPFGIGMWIAVGWLAALSLAAFFADLLPLADYKDTKAGEPLTGFSPTNLLGTDSLGRDLLSRVVYGARVSILVGIGAVILSSVVGGMIGLLAGYFRGKSEKAIMFFTDVLLAFPALLLAIGVVTFTQSRGPLTVVGVIALIYLGPTIRLVRGLTISVREREYILIARALGAKNARIIFREVMPNVIPALLSIAVVAVAGAIVAEGGLAYLNLSVAPPAPTWGSMMAAGVGRVMKQSLYPSLVPASVMFLTVFSLMFIGDRLQERNQTRESVL